MEIPHPSFLSRPIHTSYTLHTLCIILALALFPASSHANEHAIEAGQVVADHCLPQVSLPPPSEAIEGLDLAMIELMENIVLEISNPDAQATPPPTRLTALQEKITEIDRKILDLESQLSGLNPVESSEENKIPTPSESLEKAGLDAGTPSKVKALIHQLSSFQYELLALQAQMYLLKNPDIHYDRLQHWIGIHASRWITRRREKIESHSLELRKILYRTALQNGGLTPLAQSVFSNIRSLPSKEAQKERLIELCHSIGSISDSFHADPFSPDYSHRDQSLLAAIYDLINVVGMEEAYPIYQYFFTTDADQERALHQIDQEPFTLQTAMRKRLKDFLTYAQSPEAKFRNDIAWETKTIFSLPDQSEIKKYLRNKSNRLNQNQELQEIDFSINYPHLIRDIPSRRLMIKNIIPLHELASFLKGTEIREAFNKGIDTISLIIKKEGHYKTLAIKQDGTIRIIDSLKNSDDFVHHDMPTARGIEILMALQLSQIKDPHGNRIHFHRITEVGASQQKKDANSLILSLLNAHQIAKTGNFDSYQDVTAALQSGKLTHYDQISEIRKPELGAPKTSLSANGTGHRLDSPSTQAAYNEFMHSFRVKTQDLINQYDPLSPTYLAQTPSAWTPNQFLKHLQTLPETSLARKLAFYGFSPVRSVHANGRDFYFSKGVRNNGRDILVMYSRDENGAIQPRMIYRSKSSGTWRITPAVTKKNHYIKGHTAHHLHHYVQETQLHPSLTEFLNRYHDKLEFRDQPSKASFIEKTFLVTQELLENYHQTVKFVPDVSGTLHLLHQCRPGSCFKSKAEDSQPDPSPLQSHSATSYIHELNGKLQELKTIGFIPDFTQRPVREYKTSHALLSQSRYGKLIEDIQIQIYEGIYDGRGIEWHMAKDTKGRVWIDRIRFKHSIPNSYGTEKEIINAGILTNKPLEYCKQSGRLLKSEYKEAPKEPCVGADLGYRDITPLLRHLLPIQEYCRAQNIQNCVLADQEYLSQ